MEKLKPCPFCGGKAKLEKMGFPHHVYCTVCGSKVTGEGFGKEGEQSAIEKWNRRASDETCENCDHRSVCGITATECREWNDWIHVEEELPVVRPENRLEQICVDCGWVYKGGVNSNRGLIIENKDDYRGEVEE